MGAALAKMALVALAKMAEAAVKGMVAQQEPVAAMALSLLHYPDHTANHNIFFQAVPLSPADHTGGIVDSHFPRSSLLFHRNEVGMIYYSS
jgi:hypothetical protein